MCVQTNKRGISTLLDFSSLPYFSLNSCYLICYSALFLYLLFSLSSYISLRLALPVSSASPFLALAYFHSENTKSLSFL